MMGGYTDSLGHAVSEADHDQNPMPLFGLAVF